MVTLTMGLRFPDLCPLRHRRMLAKNPKTQENKRAKGEFRRKHYAHCHAPESDP
jgi:hypothetical protein